MIGAALAAAILLVGYLISWPEWKRHIAARRKTREDCAARGHDYGDVFHAFEDPHFPTRKCRVCGHQSNLTRCQARGCGNLVDRDTNEIVERKK